MTTIITVANDLDLYTRTIRENPFMNRHRLHLYDNSENNIGIPKRYNDFLANHLPEDSWLVFCHQDFAFREELQPRLEQLDKRCIYGPTGTGPTKQLVFIASLSRFGLERFRIGFYDRWKKLGRITQITPRKTQKMGRYIRKPVVVDTLDSCCMIVHSTLVRKYGLQFDENLDWHLYVEDFSLNARSRHGILTKALQLECVHLSGGTVDHVFHEGLNYLRKKYGTGRFAATCYDGYDRF